MEPTESFVQLLYSGNFQDNIKGFCSQCCGYYCSKQFTGFNDEERNGTSISEDMDYLRQQFMSSQSAVLGEDVTCGYSELFLFEEEYPSVEGQVLNLPRLDSPHGDGCHGYMDDGFSDSDMSEFCDNDISKFSESDVSEFSDINDNGSDSDYHCNFSSDEENKGKPGIFVNGKKWTKRVKKEKVIKKEGVFLTPREAPSVLLPCNHKLVSDLRQQKFNESMKRRSLFTSKTTENGDIVVDLDLKNDSSALLGFLGLDKGSGGSKVERIMRRMNKSRINPANTAQKQNEAANECARTSVTEKKCVNNVRRSNMEMAECSDDESAKNDETVSKHFNSEREGNGHKSTSKCNTFKKVTGRCVTDETVTVRETNSGHTVETCKGNGETEVRNGRKLKSKRTTKPETSEKNITKKCASSEQNDQNKSTKNGKTENRKKNSKSNVENGRKQTTDKLMERNNLACMKSAFVKLVKVENLLLDNSKSTQKCTKKRKNSQSVDHLGTKTVKLTKDIDIKFAKRQTTRKRKSRKKVENVFEKEQLETGGISLEERNDGNQEMNEGELKNSEEIGPKTCPGKMSLVLPVPESCARCRVYFKLFKCG